MFKIAKALNKGTDNPICNRLSLQFFNILDSGVIAFQKEDDKNKFKSVLFNCMKDVLDCEEYYKNYINLEYNSYKNIMSREGVKFQPIAFEYEDPTFELVRYFESFVIRAIIALRRTIKLAEIIFDKEFGGSKDFLKYIKDNKNNLYQGTMILSMLEEDKTWYKELYDIRGNVEHSDLDILKFDVTIENDNKPIVSLPQFQEKGLLRDYMKITLQNVFTHCEDVTAFLLSTKCSNSAVIVQLSPEQQPHNSGFRYVLDLNEELKKSLFINQ